MRKLLQMTALCALASLPTLASMVESTSSKSGFEIDTTPIHSSELGPTYTLTYSADAWGAASANSATITCSRNGGAAKPVGTYVGENGEVPWTPMMWGSYLFTYTSGSVTYTHTFVITGPVGSGTLADPYLAAEDRDVAQFLSASDSPTAIKYYQAQGFFVPSKPDGYTLTKVSDSPAIYAIARPMSVSAFDIDTSPIHQVKPGTKCPLAWSANGWGNGGESAAITCSRNGQAPKAFSAHSSSEGFDEWMAPHWGTNVFTFTSGSYTTNHTFIVSGSGSGKKLDPYVVTDDNDLAAFLPQGLDDYVYLTPWSGYNLAAPEGYMLEYQFGVYRLSHYLPPSSVKVTSVKQRYPWNGLVDVAYTIENTRDDHEYELTFYVKTAKGTAAILPRSSPHRMNEYDGRVANGTYTTLVDLDTQFSEVIELGAVIYAVLNDKGIAAEP